MLFLYYAMWLVFLRCLRDRFNMLSGSIPLSSQDSDWKELRDWTSDMLPRVL